MAHTYNPEKFTDQAGKVLLDCKKYCYNAVPWLPEAPGACTEAVPNAESGALISQRSDA